jgi:hypothetical protein
MAGGEAFVAWSEAHTGDVTPADSGDVDPAREKSIPPGEH